MMPFQTFLGMAHAMFRQAQEDAPPGWNMPLLDESKIFYMGDDEDFTKAINDIKGDLHEEMRERVPMPFKDTTLVSIVKRAMAPEQEKALVQNLFKIGKTASGAKIPDDAPVWVMDRTIEITQDHPAVRQWLKEDAEEVESQVSQWFIMARLHGCEKFKSAPLVWIFGYAGASKDGKLRICAPDVVAPLGSNIVSNLEQIAAISHPANYVLKVTPELTPRETRQTAAGRPRPPEKKIHFIVVDHEVLVKMRKDPSGTHASPLPHERRGHWMRLAERCRHAKLLGREKAWVRPTFVGERVWSGNKNVYEVLLDFNSKKETVR